MPRGFFFLSFPPGPSTPLHARLVSLVVHSVQQRGVLYTAQTATYLRARSRYRCGGCARVVSRYVTDRPTDWCVYTAQYTIEFYKRTARPVMTSSFRSRLTRYYCYTLFHRRRVFGDLVCLHMHAARVRIYARARACTIRYYNAARTRRRYFGGGGGGHFYAYKYRYAMVRDQVKFSAAATAAAGGGRIFSSVIRILRTKTMYAYDLYIYIYRVRFITRVVILL